MAGEWRVWNCANRLFRKIKFLQCLRRHSGKRHVWLTFRPLLRQASHDALQDGRTGAADSRMADDLARAVARRSAARSRLLAECFRSTAAELAFDNVTMRPASQPESALPLCYAPNV